MPGCPGPAPRGGVRPATVKVKGSSAGWAGYPGLQYKLLSHGYGLKTRDPQRKRNSFQISIRDWLSLPAIVSLPIRNVNLNVCV